MTNLAKHDPTLIDDWVTARYDAEIAQLAAAEKHSWPHEFDSTMAGVVQRLDYQLGLADEAALDGLPATDNQEALALTHVVLSRQVPVRLNNAAIAVLCDHPVSVRELLRRVAVTDADSEARAMALALYALIGHHNQVTHDFTEALDASRSVHPGHVFTAAIAGLHASNKLGVYYSSEVAESRKTASHLGFSRARY